MSTTPDADPIEIVVNDEPMSVAAHSTISDLLSELQIEVQRVAVERNRQVVRRNLHATTVLAAGDRVEIVGFVGGG
mgnify:CR=1 FL=1